LQQKNKELIDFQNSFKVDSKTVVSDFEEEYMEEGESNGDKDIDFSEAEVLLSKEEIETK